MTCYVLLHFRSKSEKTRKINENSGRWDFLVLYTESNFAPAVGQIKTFTLFKCNQCYLHDEVH